MTIRMYSWDDADAPALVSDSPGAMVNVLRKCLVDGYGTGEQEKPGMGWDMQWDSATNQRAAFRSADILSTQTWLYVDDRDGAVTGFAGGNRWARAWGMESFTGWDVNGDPEFTGRFPLEGQSTFGVTLAKNSAETATPVAWIVVASDRSFYLFVDHHYKTDFTHNTVPGSSHFFGDATPIIGSDEHRAILAGGAAENYTSIFLGNEWPVFQNRNADRAGCYFARSQDGLTLSPQFVHPYWGGTGASDGWGGGAGLAYLHYPAITGGVLLTRPPIAHFGLNRLRGYLPGAYAPLHDLGPDQTNFPPRTTITADGRTLVWCRTTSTAAVPGGAFIDLTGPWYD